MRTALSARAPKATRARLWRLGQFDDRLESYLHRWAERFDLSHPRHPFYQCPGLPPSLAGPVGRLAPELASGHRPTVFDHHVDEGADPVPAAIAARWLVAFQGFCLGGSCGDGGGLSSVPSPAPSPTPPPPGDGPKPVETLLLNMVAYDPEGGRPIAATGEDRPAWELGSPPAASRRFPTGVPELPHVAVAPGPVASGCSGQRVGGGCDCDARR